MSKAQAPVVLLCNGVRSPRPRASGAGGVRTPQTSLQVTSTAGTSLSLFPLGKSVSRVLWAWESPLVAASLVRGPQTVQ